MLLAFRMSFLNVAFAQCSPMTAWELLCSGEIEIDSIMLHKLTSIFMHEWQAATGFILKAESTDLSFQLLTTFNDLGEPIAS